MCAFVVQTTLHKVSLNSIQILSILTSENFGVHFSMSLEFDIGKFWCTLFYVVGILNSLGLCMNSNFGRRRFCMNFDIGLAGKFI